MKKSREITSKSLKEKEDIIENREKSGKNNCERNTDITEFNHKQE